MVVVVTVVVVVVVVVFVVVLTKGLSSSEHSFLDNLDGYIQSC